MSRNIRRCIEACRELEIAGDECEGASAKRASVELVLLECSREFLRKALREALALADERDARLRRRAERGPWDRHISDDLAHMPRLWASAFGYRPNLRLDHDIVMAHLRERPRLP